MPAVFVEFGTIWTYITYKGCRSSCCELQASRGGPTARGRWKQSSSKEATHLHMLQVIMVPHGTAGF